jgi:predicted nucleic acid-binding protein
MIFLDTGYLVALFDARDELHAQALAWTDRINEPLLVTEYILWEVVNLFSQPADRPKAHALVTLLRSEPGYEVVKASEELFEAGLALHRARPDKGWSLTDCISFVVMGERTITRALAYDQDFEQAGFEALLRGKPPGESPPQTSGG